MKLKTLFWILFISITFTCNAQYFLWGTDPASIRWEQIQTNRFQVIYPSGQDSIAQRFTNLLEYVYDAAGKTLGHAPQKISVIIHTSSTISNGSVAWAPKRMDIFDVSPQDQTSMEWLENLAIHEYRHVVQYDKLNQGLTKILYFLLGEQAPAAIGGIFLPSWFFEGDAVVTETALSKSGRGRQPEFTMDVRAQLIEKKKYSYAKAYFGSYKDHVPNHYKMGYVVVANSRDIYGPQLWNNTVTNVARRPYQIMPFNKAIKIQTSYNKRKLYHEMFNKQLIQWNLEYNREIHKSYDTLTKRNPKEYTNYLYPQRISDTYVIAEKQGLGDASKIVLISKEGIEKTIANTSFKQPNERIHTNGELVVWAETNPHIRWELQGSSDIFIYSLKTNKTERFKTKLRVFAPCISPLGDKIATVLIDSTSKYSIVVYNTATKQMIAQYPSPGQEFIQNPSWNFDASKIVYIGLSSKGKRLVELNMKNGERTVLIDYTNDDIQNPMYWNNFVIYSSSYSGVDNLYAIQTQTREILRITVAKFGARYVSAYHNVLLYSDYTSDGYMIAQIPADIRSWHTIDVVRKAKYELAESISKQEPITVNFETKQDSIYQTKPYSKLLHAVNIHSWMPFYLEYNANQSNEAGNGFQILSQDKLSSTIISAGYRKNYTNSRRAGFVKVTYTGIFPIIDLDYQNGYQEFTKIIDNDTIKILYHLSQIVTGIYIPLNFSSRSYYRYLILSSQIQYGTYSKTSINIEAYDSYFKNFFDVGIVTYSASFSNILQTSTRDIMPRIGQVFTINFAHAPLNASEIYHENIFGSTKIYLPGFYKHHSIELYAGLEWNADTSMYTIQRKVYIPRGYLEEPPTTKQAFAAHINYTSPIYYPDFAIAALVYIKRFYATAFIDYAYMNGAFVNKKLWSFGIELLSDFHVLHFSMPVNAGPRISILPMNNKLSLEFKGSINFGG
jgi:hypothetical protein